MHFEKAVQIEVEVSVKWGIASTKAVQHKMASKRKKKRLPTHFQFIILVTHRWNFRNKNPHYFSHPGNNFTWMYVIEKLNKCNQSRYNNLNKECIQSYINGKKIRLTYNLGKQHMDFFFKKTPIIVYLSPQTLNSLKNNNKWIQLL